MKKIKLSLLIVLSLIASNSIFAQNWYVSTSGSNGNTGTTPNSAFATIKYAVSQASNGQTISVAAGTYTEQNISINKNITISGADAGTTIIQAQTTQPDGTAPMASYNIIGLAGTADVTLNNLTLRHGNSTSAGGAIVVYSTQKLTIQSCNIMNCYSSWGGGGICSTGSLTINNSAIANNTANTNGGGILATGGSVSIKNSVIYNNTANSPVLAGGNGGGGAIFLKDATLSMVNNTIAFNKCSTATVYSYGIRMEGSNGATSSTKNTLLSNNLFFNSINNVSNSGVDIGVQYAGFYADAANNTNNIFSYAFPLALSSTTIPSEASNYPTAAQVALGTFTMGSNGVYSLPILSGSIAIGAANPATATSTDIYGTIRTTPDIGAFEYIPNTSTHDIKTSMDANIVFPSPSNGEFTLDLPNNPQGKLEVYSLSGQKVFNQSINDGNVLVKLPVYVKGIVILRFAGDKVVYTQKLQIV